MSNQASEKIANLTEEKAKLEKENEKTLRSSIATTLEAKRLLLLQKEWTQERRELLARDERGVERARSRAAAVGEERA